eukprot:3192197-Amphidinium_carterae.1
MVRMVSCLILAREGVLVGLDGTVAKVPTVAALLICTCFRALYGKSKTEMFERSVREKSGLGWMCGLQAIPLKQDTTYVRAHRTK